MSEDRRVCFGEGAARVTFSDIFDPYSDGYKFRYFTAEIEDVGLKASATVITMESGAGLAAFVTSLSNDWRGWEGARKWRAIEDHLQISAEHDPTGKVGLLVELRQSPYPGAWNASVSITIAAGEELRLLAEQLTDFCA